MCGRPLIAYTIEAALASSMLDAVFVSTEDDEIELVSRRAGAEVIRHPPELSGENSPTIPVVAWDLVHLEQSCVEIDLVAVMRATTPLRTSEDIDAAVDLLLSEPDADSVVSVTASTVNPVRLKRILVDGRLEDAFDGEGQRPKRRQDFETFYVRNGAVYVSKRHVVTPTALWGARCLAYKMPADRSVNINTEFEFRIAELLMSSRSP